MTKDSFYFQHDYNARSDERVLMLRAEHGAAGYGIFWMILESIVESSDGAIHRVAIGGLSLGYGVASSLLEEVLDYCVDIGLLYETQGQAIKSKRMDRHIAYREALRAAGRAGAAKRWPQSHKNSHPNAKERKGKERKYNSSPTGSLSRITVDDKKLAIKFATMLTETNPAFSQKFKGADLEKKCGRWADDFEKLRRIDKATHEQMSFMIEWLAKSPSRDATFWRGNIQSGAKLREHFPRLVSAIQREVQDRETMKHRTVAV